MNIAKFLRTPILKNVSQRLLLHRLSIKTSDALAAANIRIKQALKIDESVKFFLTKFAGVMAHVFSVREVTFYF